MKIVKAQPVKPCPACGMYALEVTLREAPGTGATISAICRACGHNLHAGSDEKTTQAAKDLSESSPEAGDDIN